ncbi:MAG: PhnD/SsuA/transferrin family substrate-binding protein [Azoarcus sp.]|jgi:two-component system sensor histidine kinase TtrS|nr:PhnD/SsuA/transferrin family substrate-binding protein [Azoarcus sp.]
MRKSIGAITAASPLALRRRSALASQLRRLCTLLLFACLPAFAATVDPGVSAGTVRIGVLAFRGAETAVDEWSPMLDNLSQISPELHFELLKLDHDGLRAAVAERKLDFVITNPGHYVELEAEFGVSRILTLVDALAVTPERAIGSAVIVRKERQDLQTLDDLRAKRLAIVGREGFGGFQIVWKELLDHGIDPAQDLAELRSVGLPMDGVLAAVERGEVDAGVIRACMLEGLGERASIFRVLSPRSIEGFPCATSTRLYPNWPMAALHHTSPELARKVAIVLLSSTDGAGPGWSVPADYQSVHELFRSLEIGPYTYLRKPGLIELAERYWPWLLGLLAVMAGGALYTVHVEHLVHKRTTALRAALLEREQLEAGIRASQEQADHLARLSMLGELSGTLAHELNQPLATIGNYASSLSRRVDNGRLSDDAVREAAGEIVGQAERAAAILGRIRAFARKRIARRELFRPAIVATEAISLFRGMLAHAPEVELIDHLPEERMIEGDPLQVQQVLLNLLKNGYDAARELPPDRRTLIVGIEASDGEVRFRVRDHGPGLDKEALRHLFEPFFTTKPDGLGLGLSICKTIAEAHGGRLSAAPPDDGPGMIFTLSLPANV